MGYIVNTEEDVSKLKKTVRRNVLAVRDALPAADRAKYDAGIRDIITGMEEYREAGAILAYVSYRSEVDTLMLIEQAWADGKSVFAPKVSGNEMEFWRITAMEDLQEGYKGIWEPIQTTAFMEWIKEYHISFIDSVDEDANKDAIRDNTARSCKVMLWMPGAAFDRERHRIGYGGGFYDRYLSRFSQITKQTASTEQSKPYFELFTLTTAALAYSCQVLDKIPYKEHDIKPDLLITEQGIVR